MQKRRCDLCGQQKGGIEIQVYRDQKPQKLFLCTECALKLLENNSFSKDQTLKLVEANGNEVFQMITEMRSLLSEIASQIHAIETQKSTPTQKQCLCGLTYEEFKESGYLGCPWCYETFREDVDNLLHEIERGCLHRGMIPQRYTYLLIVQKELDYLKRQLQRFVAQEAYEEAARVQRKIKRILSKHSGMENI